jgi:hypothetical protein
MQPNLFHFATSDLSQLEPYGFYILLALLYLGILGIIMALPMALLGFVFHAIAGV